MIDKYRAEPYFSQLDSAKGLLYLANQIISSLNLPDKNPFSEGIEIFKKGYELFNEANHD